MSERTLSPDILETREDRANLGWYLMGAIPGALIGAVAGFYYADGLNDSYELLKEAPRVVRGAIDALGLILGGTAGDIVGGFSVLGIRSVVGRFSRPSSIRHD
ncbi:MAG: hypothetical protein ABH864_00390 [archaeon]